MDYEMNIKGELKIDLLGEKPKPIFKGLDRIDLIPLI